jgi:hypothetical protein
MHGEMSSVVRFCSIEHQVQGIPAGKVQPSWERAMGKSCNYS